MKQRASAFVALALCSATGLAAAQSSVTVFGVLDANLRSIKNGATSVKQLGTDGLTSSRLGFRGVEDLGGGLKANFWLESALNLDDGTINSSGKFWHRRATVGLEGAFGELRLGRDFAPTYTGISDFDVFGDTGVGKFSNLQSKLTGTVNTNTRVDNEVSYFLPKTLGGVYGQVSIAPGEATLGNKYSGGRVGYAAGPLNVSLALGQTQANAADDKYKIMALGGAYDFGVARVLVSYSENKFVARKEKLLLIGATAPIGQGTLRVSYGRADLTGGTTATLTGDGDDATLMAIGYVHNLSKRTALYTTYSRISNKGGQKFVVGATTPGIGAGLNSTGFELGVRHAF